MTSALLQRILLGGALLLCGCNGSTPTCRNLEMTIPVSPDLPDAAADGGLGNDLTLCLADRSGCDRLCQDASPAAPPGYTMGQCQLVQVDGGFAVQVVYMMLCPE